jgi:membrane-associated phospholipid phosphatase
MNQRALGLFGCSLVSTLGYLLIARQVRRGATRAADRDGRLKIQRGVSPVSKHVAEATGHIGKWYGHVPPAVVGAGVLGLRGMPVAGAAIATTSLAAALISPVLDRAHQHRTPPPGKLKIKGDVQSFPSGHAFETTAVAIAAGYTLAREAVVPPFVAAPLAAAASLISGLGRLVLDRHWPTDSAAGYCAGIALGTACAGVYELTH